MPSFTSVAILPFGWLVGCFLLSLLCPRILPELKPANSVHTFMLISSLFGSGWYTACCNSRLCVAEESKGRAEKSAFWFSFSLSLTYGKCFGKVAHLPRHGRLDKMALPNLKSKSLWLWRTNHIGVGEWVYSLMESVPFQWISSKYHFCQRFLHRFWIYC